MTDPITTLGLLDELVKKGIIAQKNIDEASSAKKESGKSVLHHLVEMGAVTEDQLLEKLAIESGMPPIHIWRYPIKKELTEIVPKQLADEFMIVPITKTGEILTVAMAEPWDQNALNELKQCVGELTIAPTLSAEQDIKDAINTIYGDNYESELQKILEGIEGESLQLMDADNQGGITDASILLSLTDQEPVVRLTNNILTEGVERKASDIFVEPGDKQLIIRYRVDGVLQEGQQPPMSMHQGVLSRLKIMSNLDIAEQRLPQDGRVKFKIENRWVEFRLSTIPSYFGEKACLRILDPGQIKLKLNLLGFDEHSLTQIKTAVANPYGMILVCGPTGSGKTTTLYSILNHVDSVEKNLITVEDPVEYHIDGVNQVNVKIEVQLTFASAQRPVFITTSITPSIVSNYLKML